MMVYRNSNRSHLIRSSFALIAMLFWTNAVLASGYMAVPEMRQKMASFKACVAQLERHASDHQKQLKSRTLEPDGRFREVSIQPISDGVKITGRNSARYGAKIWYHNGWLTKDGTQYEISHSWSDSSYECRGKMMIVNASQGFTLTTFEPVASKTP